MRQGLIVTADDFGLAPQVNEAVERSHREGVLTTASLMVAAPAVDEAVAIARRNPRLRVGLHLVLVEGRPILPAERVAHLVRRPSGPAKPHSAHSTHRAHGAFEHAASPLSGADPDSADSSDSSHRAVELAASPPSGAEPDSAHSPHGAQTASEHTASPLSAADPDSTDSSDAVFRTDMVGAGVTLFFNPAARRELAAEIEAQFAAYAATGLALDHVTTHKHFHLHPTIAGLILSVGRRYGLRAARTPLEPPRPLRAAEPGYRAPPALVTAPWARLVQARFRRAGVFTPDRVLGLRWSGAMSERRVLGLVQHLPPGVSELYTHPATASGFPGEAPGYAYADELAALTSPRVVEAVRRSGATLGGFADFAAGPRAAVKVGAARGSP